MQAVQHVTRCSLTIVALVAIGASLLPAADDPLKAAFQSPAPAHRPFVRWWWPGGDVDDTTLAQQIRDLAAAGFGGAEIEAFTLGLPMEKVMGTGTGDRINDYVTPRFFGHVAAAAKAAQESGLRLDYTLNSSYPSGGGDEITPALALRELSVSHQTVRGPAPFAGKIAPPALRQRLGFLMDQMTGGLPPAVAEELKAQEKLVAVVAYRGTGPTTKPHTSVFGIPDPEGIVEQAGVLDPQSAIVLTDHVRPDGSLDWTVPEGEWQLLVFKQYVSDVRVPVSAGRGLKFVLDHLNQAAFAAHAQRSYGNGGELLAPFAGGSLRALFVDSLELNVDAYWRDDFLAEFQRRRGYELTPFLAAISVPGWEVSYHSLPNPPLLDLGETGERVREDYRLTLSELMLENFYAPFEAYARSQGLVSRMQVHGAPVDVLQGYGVATIPETESMAVTTLPTDFRLQFARSAANIYGKPLVAAESLCWQGNPYAPTPETWKRRADLFFVVGVNQLVFHGYSYPYLNDVPPGWHPFSPPYGFSSFFSTAHPYWSHLRPFTDYVARLQAVLQQSAPVVPVAIYRAPLSADAVSSPGGAAETAGLALSAAGYYSDLLNADGLINSRAENGRLVTPGGAAYAAIVLPRVEALRVEVAQQIAALAAQGIPMVFLDGEPTRAEGWLNHEENDAQVRRTVAMAKRAAKVRSVASADFVAALKTLGVAPNLRFQEGGSVPFIERRAGDRRFVFLYNPDEAERRVVFEFATEGGAEKWDAWSGAILPQATSAVPGSARVELTLTGGESVLLAFTPTTKPTALSSAAMPVTRTMPLGESGWTFHGTGYGKDGRAVDVTETWSSLLDWTTVESIKDLAGAGTYTTTFQLEADALSPHARVMLDLGTVHDLAVVSINGRAVRTLLLRPFTVEITAEVRAGENQLQVTVANSPNNAMVGRALAPLQPGIPPASYSPTPAGLLGPVVIRIE